MFIRNKDNDKNVGDLCLTFQISNILLSYPNNTHMYMTKLKNTPNMT